jgi:betaine/carnitine transporter, BCCT family
LDIHNPVFFVSAIWLTSTFDWLFMSAANIFVLFCLFLVVSPWGKVRLGGADARPDFSYLGWFAMLFAAGMGIGLMFFGVLEPSTTSKPALGRRSRGRGRGPGRRHGRHHLPLGPASLGDLCRGGAHAGLLHLQQRPALDHPLGLLPAARRPGLGLARPCHRHLAVFATLFGLATSLGFGASRPRPGSTTSSASPPPTRPVVLIVAITAVALVSVMRA